MAEPKKIYNANDVRLALRVRYCQPEWALFEEVANGTGAGVRAYADAVAVNLFPSRGLAVHGFEIKVSKSDWKSELAKPQKSEHIQRYCDFWWIVAPKDIVNPADLPPTWGLLELDGRGLRVTVKAPQLTPEPINRSFFAALCRRTLEQAGSVRRQEIDRILENERATMRQRLQDDIKRSTVAHENLKQAVAIFEAETGLKITGWDFCPKEMGKAVVIVRQMLKKYNGDINAILKASEALAKTAALVESLHIELCAMIDHTPETEAY